MTITKICLTKKCNLINDWEKINQSERGSSLEQEERGSFSKRICFNEKIVQLLRANETEEGENKWFF